MRRKKTGKSSAPPAGAITIRRVLNDGQTELVPVDLLKPHPRNPRDGDLGAVMASIAQNGFYGALIAQKGSCHILAGNHRYLAARGLGYTELPVIWLDVDDEEALRILIADNRTSDLGGYNMERLAELLAELKTTTGDELAGTGYSDGDLDDLIKDLARGATGGDAEPDGPKKRGDDVLAIVLVCESEDEQESLHDKLQSMGFYPRKTVMNERTQLAIGRA